MSVFISSPAASVFRTTRMPEARMSAPYSKSEPVKRACDQCHSRKVKASRLLGDESCSYAHVSSAMASSRAEDAQRCPCYAPISTLQNPEAHHRSEQFDASPNRC
jgi:hypothetical protein